MRSLASWQLSSSPRLSRVSRGLILGVRSLLGLLFFLARDLLGISLAASRVTLGFRSLSKQPRLHDLWWNR